MIDESDARHRAWSAEHTAALKDLQEAQRAYHRLVTETAFVAGGEIVEAQREALARLDEARQRLDEIRSRRPHG